MLGNQYCFTKMFHGMSLDEIWVDPLKEGQEAERMDYAIKKLTEAGMEVDRVDDKTLQFLYQGEIVSFWPWKGWHSGKSIKDGRGLRNLLNQLKP